MRLSSIAEQDALIYLERYVDEATRTYSAFSIRNEAGPRYRPQSDQPGFNLVAVWVPADQVQIVESDPDRRLKRFYVKDDQVRFVIHPETWAALDVPFMNRLQPLPQAARIEAAPTASTRTVWPRGSDAVPPHFLKLHYPKYVSRFKRTLRRLNIHNSVAITQEMKSIHHPRFAFFPEVLGLVFGEGPDGWGLIVREAAPQPPSENRWLVPCFALFGGDMKHPAHPALITQMIDRTGEQPESFILNRIMIPVIECWAKAARERGILLESHAQNTLLELDSDFTPQRIVHRDFDVWIDLEARQRLGLDAPFLGHGISDYPAEQYYSVVYDRFIGRAFFEYLLTAVVRRFPEVDARRVRQQVCDAFHSAFPEAGAFFPAKTTYYFADDLRPDGKYYFVDTGEPPVWR